MFVLGRQLLLLVDGLAVLREFSDEPLVSIMISSGWSPFGTLKSAASKSSPALELSNKYLIQPGSNLLPKSSSAPFNANVFISMMVLLFNERRLTAR